MKKFINLHEGGVPVLVNLDDVRRVESHEHNAGCSILVSRAGGNVCAWVNPDESFPVVRTMIASCQGGFPVLSGAESVRGLD